MKPAKIDKKAPKELLLRIVTNNKRASQWLIANGKLRQFKDGQGGMGYNFSTRCNNPENGEQYIFSGNLVLIGSAPKAKVKAKNGK